MNNHGRYKPEILSEYQFKESLRAINEMIKGILNCRVRADREKYIKLIKPLEKFTVGYEMLKEKL